MGLSKPAPLERACPLAEAKYPLPLLITLTWLLHSFCVLISIKNDDIALIGVAQWIERGMQTKGFAGLIPSQGTCLGCRPGPQYGAHERQPHIDVFSPSFSLLFTSL